MHASNQTRYRSIRPSATYVPFPCPHARPSVRSAQTCEPIMLTCIEIHACSRSLTGADFCTVCSAAPSSFIPHSVAYTGIRHAARCIYPRTSQRGYIRGIPTSALTSANTPDPRLREFLLCKIQRALPGVECMQAGKGDKMHAYHAIRRTICGHAALGSRSSMTISSTSWHWVGLDLPGLAPC